MRDKFNEKLLADPEDIEKPVESVDAYVARSKNEPQPKPPKKPRHKSSRARLKYKQRLMSFRIAMRNRRRIESFSSPEMSISFNKDDDVRRRLLYRKLRILAKKQKGTGNKILSVESANHNSGNWRNYYRNVVKNPKETFVDDPLRGRGGKFYQTHQHQMRKDFYNRTPFSLWFSEPTNTPTTSDYGETSEWILLKADKKFFMRKSRGANKFSKHYWEAFIFGGSYRRKRFESTILENTIFTDHFYERTSPIYQNVMEGEQSKPKKNFITSKSVYNFYNEKYEDFLTDTEVPHNALPNLYNFLSEVVSDDTVDSVKEQNTLGGVIEGENPFLRTPRGMFKSAVKESTLQEYLKKYGLKFKEAKRLGKIEEIVAKSSNVIFPLTQTKEMVQADYKKEFFPMYNELEFTIDPDSEFVDILETAKMEDEFTKNVVQLILNKESSVINFVENTLTPDGKKENREIQKKVWDLSKDILSQGRDYGELFEKNITILGDDDALNNLSQKRNMFFFNNIVNLAFYAKVQEYIRNHFRTYEDMINGEKAHSEVVIYRVAKYIGQPNGEPIKNYFFLNKADLETFNFVDTQVKVNEEYSYEVYSYDLVIGNSYSYAESKSYSESATVAVKVNQQPSLKIIENKIAQTANLILSEPPTMPDVNVYPFFNTDNKIGFNFNGSVGNRLMLPITFSEQEKKRIDKLKKSQNRQGQERIWYSQDGINRFYEVYRTTTPPSSPMDFMEIMTIRTPNTSFVDSIEPNTTYYYLFRAIDNHGNVSNPSEVIQATIIRDQFIYPVIKNYSYEIAKNKTKETKKDLKRYLRISPVLSSMLIDKERTDVSVESANKVVKATMGPKGTSVWGKKFKVRVTSKNSGKKLDLNFKFTQEFEKPTDEVI